MNRKLRKGAYAEYGSPCGLAGFQAGMERSVIPLQSNLYDAPERMMFCQIRVVRRGDMTVAGKMKKADP
jgi:hypothetical protein